MPAPTRAETREGKAPLEHSAGRGGAHAHVPSVPRPSRGRVREPRAGFDPRRRVRERVRSSRASTGVDAREHQRRASRTGRARWLGRGIRLRLGRRGTELEPSSGCGSRRRAEKRNEKETSRAANTRMILIASRATTTMTRRDAASALGRSVGRCAALDGEDEYDSYDAVAAGEKKREKRRRRVRRRRNPTCGEGDVHSPREARARRRADDDRAACRVGRGRARGAP